MQDFHNLKVWERSHQLTLSVYKLTATFPKEEMYGITNQLRRASVSIPTNIAEGCGRVGDNEFARFITIAIGSASETEYLLILSNELGYMKQTDFDHLIKNLTEMKQMLISLLKKVKTKK
ncbi:MAG: four helix bundle protein [Anaerolineales bacterium]|nr:four helix bundle protein [Anaerolineales bacterium]